MFGITDPINPADQTPFQPWAKALYDARQIHELEPHTRCKASGTARQFQTPYGVEFVEMPALKRALHFRYRRPAHVSHGLHGRPLASRRSRAELLRPLDRLVGRRHARHRQHGLQRELLARSPRHAAHDASCTRSSGSRARTPRRSPTRSRSTIPAPTRRDWTGAFDLQFERGVELFEYSCQQANYAVELMVGGERSSIDRTSPIVP